MKKCLIEGCCNKYYAKGYCEKHYQRISRGLYGVPDDNKGHHNIGIEKLWNNINKNGISITNIGTPCWTWNLRKTHGGYGNVFIDGSMQRTHCLAWKTYYNKEIPKGMHICHKCDTPACCNPEHLFLGTPKDNAQDKVRKGRCYTGDHKGEKCGRAKLTEKQVLEIRKDDRSNRAIAKDYNLDYSSISDIKRRKTWKHI